MRLCCVTKYRVLTSTANILFLGSFVLASPQLENNINDSNVPINETSTGLLHDPGASCHLIQCAGYISDSDMLENYNLLSKMYQLINMVCVQCVAKIKVC